MNPSMPVKKEKKKPAPSPTGPGPGLVGDNGPKFAENNPEVAARIKAKLDLAGQNQIGGAHGALASMGYQNPQEVLNSLNRQMGNLENVTNLTPEEKYNLSKKMGTTPFNPDMPTLTHAQTQNFTQDQAIGMGLKPDVSNPLTGNNVIDALRGAVLPQSISGIENVANTGNETIDKALNYVGNNPFETAGYLTMAKSALKMGYSIKPSRLSLDYGPPKLGSNVNPTGLGIEYTPPKLDLEFNTIKNAFNKISSIGQKILNKNMFTETIQAALGRSSETILKQTISPSGKIVTNTINTVTQKNVGQVILSLAKGSIAVTSLVGAGLFGYYIWPKNEKTDIFTTLSIAQKSAADAQLWDLVEQIDNDMTEASQIIETTPIYGFGKVSEGKINAAIRNSEVQMARREKINNEKNIK